MKLNVGRKYEAHLVLAAVRPWRPTVWKRVAPALAPAFGAPAKTAVRTNQKLGKLGFADAARWTGAKDFRHLEMWSPSWNDFARTGQPPDAFLFITDPKNFGVKHTDGVASYVLLAVAADAPGRADIAAFVRALDPVHHFVARRAWARMCGDGFEDSLQDFVPTLEPDERTGKLRPPAAWKPVG